MMFKILFCRRIHACLTFFIIIHGVVCVQLAHFSFGWLKGYIYSSCYYHHQIGSIHLSHCYHIFPWLCAWDVCYIIFCHLLYIRSGKIGNLFSLLLCSLWWVLADRTRLFVQYTISSSSLCKLIWRHWTYKMPVRYILSSVWVRCSIFSPLSSMQCVGLYVSSLPISLVMIERIYIFCLIIIIKSEVWTITHCLGLAHETMVSAVCLSTFLWYRKQLFKLFHTWLYCFMLRKLGDHGMVLIRPGEIWWKLMSIFATAAQKTGTEPCRIEVFICASYRHTLVWD